MVLKKSDLLEPLYSLKGKLLFPFNVLYHDMHASYSFEFVLCNVTLGSNTIMCNKSRSDMASVSF